MMALFHMQVGNQIIKAVYDKEHDCYILMVNGVMLSAHNNQVYVYTDTKTKFDLWEMYIIDEYGYLRTTHNTYLNYDEDKFWQSDVNTRFTVNTLTHYKDLYKAYDYDHLVSIR